MYVYINIYIYIYSLIFTFFLLYGRALGMAQSASGGLCAEALLVNNTINFP